MEVQPVEATSRMTAELYLQQLHDIYTSVNMPGDLASYLACKSSEIVCAMFWHQNGHAEEPRIFLVASCSTTCWMDGMG